MVTPDLSKLKIDRASSVHSGMSRRRHWPKIMTIIILIIGATAAAGTYFTSTPSVETTTVVLAYPAQNYTLLNATGYAVAQRKAALSSKATGRLEWLGVLEGNHVKKDELIARLESKDVGASLDQAKANVKLAQANLGQGEAELHDAEQAFKRSLDLLEHQYISASAHDVASARLQKAKASINGLRAAINAAQAAQQAAQVAFDQTLIRAPFNGVILTKSANVGDNITPFSAAADSKGAVVTLADMDTLEVEADVSESNLSKIKIDQPCEIQFEAFPELRLAGQVSRMVPTLDRSKATLLVKVRFIERDPRVLPDMSAKVAFLSQAITPQEKKPLPAILPTAITERNGKKVVFVVKDNTLHQVEVTVGAKVGELIAIQGANAGDKVVLSPNEKLKDGSKISIAKK